MQITFNTPLESYHRDQCGPGWHRLVKIGNVNVHGNRLLYVSPARNEFIFIDVELNQIHCAHKIDDVICNVCYFLPAPEFTMKINNPGVRIG